MPAEYVDAFFDTSGAHVPDHVLGGTTVIPSSTASW
jgi:hypothetical protein